MICTLHPTTTYLVQKWQYSCRVLSDRSNKYIEHRFTTLARNDNLQYVCTHRYVTTQVWFQHTYVHTYIAPTHMYNTSLNRQYQFPTYAHTLAHTLAHTYVNHRMKQWNLCNGHCIGAGLLSTTARLQTFKRVYRLLVHNSTYVCIQATLSITPTCLHPKGDQYRKVHTPVLKITICLC